MQSQLQVFILLKYIVQKNLNTCLTVAVIYVSTALNKTILTIVKFNATTCPVITKISRSQIRKN